MTAGTNIATLKRMESRLGDWHWRLDSLYRVIDTKGRDVPFRLNWAQERLFNNMHYRNVILKARQIGFTTFIQIFMLDAALFNSNVQAGTIADTQEHAEEIFRHRIKFPYQNLPEDLQVARATIDDSARKLSFSNNSSIRVAMSMRSGTVQYLHVSELGRIAALYPEKAREIRTGALNALHAGEIGFIESTAMGQDGDFYDICRTAQDMAREGRPLGKLDWKFHFYAWWEHEPYSLDAEGVVVSREMEGYFERLESQIGITLTDGQKAWYVATERTQRGDMKREYPSTPEEAFHASIEGAYFSTQMAKARQQGRICRVPHDPALQVNTFWDLGLDDYMAIWFHQRFGMENRFIDYYENNGEGIPHYARVLREKAAEREYVYGRHYFPHDMAVKSLSTGQRERILTAQRLGLTPFDIVPRIDRKEDAIEAARTSLSSSWFDEVECATGIKRLDGYRREWDERRAVWKDSPRKDINAHGADAYMQFATGFVVELEEDDRHDIEEGWQRDETTGY